MSSRHLRHVHLNALFAAKAARMQGEDAMSLERIAKVVLEHWRAGRRTPARLLTLSDHLAFQYQLSAATVYDAALKLVGNWEWESER